MIVVREWLAGIIFCVALAGIFTLVVDGFEWSIIAAITLCFVVAYFVWPSKRKGQRDNDSRFADIIEILIELPIELFLWIVRLLIRILGGKGDGVDLSL